MGNQPDGLLKMEKFDGNETKIIWPAWKLDLDRRITFEFGAIGVNIEPPPLQQAHVDVIVRHRNKAQHANPSSAETSLYVQDCLL